MNKVVFVSFKNETLAYQGAEALRDLRTITLYAGAVIAQDADGKIIVRQSVIERPSATLGGLLVGNLLGLLGPVAIAVNRGSGAFLGAAMNAAKAGITTEFVKTIQGELALGKTGLIAEIDEEWESPIDIRMEALGGTVFRQTRTQAEEAFFEKEIQTHQAELANLEGERVASAKIKEQQRSAERDAKLQAKIEATKRKIREKENQLSEWIKSVREEGEDKIAVLQGQMTTADEESKVQLDHQLRHIRAEYQLRAKKLSQALERCKKAHAA